MWLDYRPKDHANDVGDARVQGQFTNLQNPSLPLPLSPGEAASVAPGKFSGKVGTPDKVVQLTFQNSSVLMNTTGDFEFLINITRPGVKSVEVYLPPEFKVSPGGDSNVWTNVTDNYRFISFRTVGQKDVGFGLAPGWWTARIRSPTPGEMAPINSKVIIRIFNVTSPVILGRYFFKVTLDGFPIKATDFPQIIVKGDINPAFISGTVRIGGLDTSLYGQPISAAMPDGCGGRVVGFGRDIRNRLISAQAYFNKTANGQYTLYGLPAGTYNLTAEACGFPPQPLGKAVSVLPTQSVDGVDFFLYNGPTITGTIFSRCINNIITWGNAFPIQPFAPFNRAASSRSLAVDLYDANSGALIATNFPYTPVDFTDPALTSVPFRLHEQVGFSGHIPQAFAGFTSGIPPGDYQLRVYVEGYVQLSEVKVRVPSNVGFHFIPIDAIKRQVDLWRTNPIVATLHFKNQTGIFKTTPTSRQLALVLAATDEAGTLKGWNVTVIPAGTTDTTLEIDGFQGLYQFRGIRDQGLLPRTYLLKTYISGWLQPELPFATVDFCTTDVKPTFLSFDVIRGGVLNLTVISVNATSGVVPTIPVNWAYPRSNMTLQVFDTAGRSFGFNRTVQPTCLSGFVPIGNLCIKSVDNSRTTPIGTPFFQVTFDGMDNFQLVFRKTLFPYIFGAVDQVLDTGTYIFRIRTLGYLDEGPYSIAIQPGRITDFSFKMIIGPIIEVNMNFQTQNVFAQVGATTRDYLLISNATRTTLLNATRATSLRVEVFDRTGKFIAANITLIPVNGFTARIPIIGFDSYGGSLPSLRWYNFFDSTDGAFPLDAGIPPGSYVVRIIVPRYWQSEPTPVTVQLGARSVVTITLQRFGHIFGFVRGPDAFKTLIPLSWAAVGPNIPVVRETLVAPSLEGFYELWLPAGNHILGAQYPGYSLKTVSVSLTWGAEQGLNFFLVTGAPQSTNVPEVSSPQILLGASTLVAFLLMARLNSRANPRRSTGNCTGYAASATGKAYLGQLSKAA